MSDKKRVAGALEQNGYPRISLDSDLNLARGSKSDGTVAIHQKRLRGGQEDFGCGGNQFKPISTLRQSLRK